MWKPCIDGEDLGMSSRSSTTLDTENLLSLTITR
jgi:hypothetical protein